MWDHLQPGDRVEIEFTGFRDLPEFKMVDKALMTFEGEVISNQGAFIEIASDFAKGERAPSNALAIGFRPDTGYSIMKSFEIKRKL